MKTLATQKYLQFKGRLIVRNRKSAIIAQKWSQHLTRLERHRYFFMPQRQYTG
jgi:hypothetical protein